MADEQLVEYLVGEVEEFMGAGRVGIYEFLEILRSVDDPASEAKMHEVSIAALRHILESGTAALEWHKWADIGYSQPATLSDLSPKEWRTPTEAPYLAVAPV